MPTGTIQYQKGMDALLAEIKKCSNTQGKVRCIMCQEYKATRTAKNRALFTCDKCHAVLPTLHKGYDQGDAKMVPLTPYLEQLKAAAAEEKKRLKAEEAQKKLDEKFVAWVNGTRNEYRPTAKRVARLLNLDSLKKARFTCACPDRKHNVVGGAEDMRVLVDSSTLTDVVVCLQCAQRAQTLTASQNEPVFFMMIAELIAQIEQKEERERLAAEEAQRLDNQRFQTWANTSRNEFSRSNRRRLNKGLLEGDTLCCTWPECPETGSPDEMQVLVDGNNPDIITDTIVGPACAQRARDLTAHQKTGSVTAMIVSGACKRIEMLEAEALQRQQKEDLQLQEEGRVRKAAEATLMVATLDSIFGEAPLVQGLVSELSMMRLVEETMQREDIPMLGLEFLASYNLFHCLVEGCSQEFPKTNGFNLPKLEAFLCRKHYSALRTEQDEANQPEHERVKAYRIDRTEANLIRIATERAERFGQHSSPSVEALPINMARLDAKARARLERKRTKKARYEQNRVERRIANQAMAKSMGAGQKTDGKQKKAK